MNISEYTLRKHPVRVPQELKSALQNTITWHRAEKIPKDLYYPLFVGENLINQMTQNSNNIIWGRRGTGKTHLLKAFCQYINEKPEQKELSIFISLCDARKSESPIISTDQFDNDNLKQTYFARESFKNFLLLLIEELDKQIYVYVEQKLLLSNQKQKAVIKKAIEKTTELYLNIVSGKPQIKQIVDTETSKTNMESKRGKGIEFSLRGIINAFLKKELAENNIYYIKNRTENNLTDKESKKYVEYSINEMDLQDIRRRFLEIIEVLQLDTLYICIDELSSLDEFSTVFIQPLFLEYLKAFCFKNEKVSVKIASIRDCTRLSNRNFNHKFVGLEYGQDITPLLDLDEAYFYKDKSALLDYFSRMLVNRVIRYDASLMESMERAPEAIIGMVIKYLFMNESNFECLVMVSHGIPRLFFRILSECLQKIKIDIEHYFIHKNLVYEEAINIYLNEKRQLVSLNTSSETLYTRINEYIASNQKNLFLLENNESEGRNEVVDLLNKELIHKIPSPIMAREIMDRYQGYYVDYGNYLHYIKSKYKSYDKVSILPTNKLPVTAENYLEYVLDLNKIETEVLSCNKCSCTFSKHHPVYEKHNICPHCAFKFG